MDVVLLGSIGEFVAAIAVVISLIFVAFQLRSNTRAVKASTYQSIHDAEDRFWRDISNDPKLAELWAISPNGLDNFSDTDRYQCEMLLNRLVFMIQATHYQRQRGFVGDEIWPAWHLAWIGFLRENKAVREMYDTNVPVFSPEFIAYSEQCILDGLEGEGGSGTLTH